jgi:hypothetical protein
MNFIRRFFATIVKGEFSMLKLCVAEIKLLISGDINQLFIDRTAPYLSDWGDADRSELADISVNFRHVSEIAKPSGQVIGTIGNRTYYYNENGGLCHYAVIPGTDKIYILAGPVGLSDSTGTNGTGNAKSVENISILCYDFHDTPEISLDYPLLNATDSAVRIPFLKHGALVLHASAITHNGVGIAFSAPSGTGKSTQTSLWHKNFPGVSMINDDAPIIRAENGTPYIYGSPWAGSTGISANVKVPLKAVVFLEQAKTDTVTLLDKSEAMPLFMQGFSLPKTPRMMLSLLETADEIMKNTNFYLLKCTPFDSAARALYDAVFDTV